MANSSLEVSVQSFSDFRTFLLAYVQRKKDTDPKWTFGRWAYQLKLNSTSSITKIIQGQRDPGDDVTQRLVRYFKFNQDECEYFKDLVSLQKLKKDPRLSVLLMEQMAKKYPLATSRLMDDKTFSVISNWYCLPIRELVREKDFQEKLDEIAKRFYFNITPRDVKKAIDALLATGLMVRNKKGFLEVSEGRLKTSDDISSEAIQRYHEQMSQNAAKAVRMFDVAEREFSSSTLWVSKNKMAEAKTLIREFKDKFVRLMEVDPGDQVYHFQIQFFPVTKEKKS